MLPAPPAGSDPQTGPGAQQPLPCAQPPAGGAVAGVATVTCMGLFRRGAKSTDPGEGADDTGLLMLQGQDMIAQTGRAHADRWGLGTAQRWDLDQETGTIRWTFRTGP